MPPPQQGVAEQCWQGVGRPLTMATHHHLRVVGHGMDQDGFPMVLCPVCIDLKGVSLVPLHKSTSKSVFR
jgi:hypothetical protein